ncbi:MAG: HlyD family secretion protein [Halieaceae bacterium]|jgi:HlyD family secretion protein
MQWMSKSFTGLFLASLVLFTQSVAARNVSCLGRVEPENGVYELAGPSALAVVRDLMVSVGDQVEKGALLATMDTYPLVRAQVGGAQAALDFARGTLERERNLQGMSSKARVDEAERDVLMGEAELAAAKARLERAQVRAPVDGEILVIHAREGERIGDDGLLELGQTRRMFVVAEVYETDIGLVELGQPAIISGPALDGLLTGSVHEIGKVVGRIDSLALDPVARTDSRVVEVKILLDDPTQVAGLTNLQVDVEIGE